MAEINRYEFTYREVAEALIKQQGLHEGIWSVSLKFGIGAIMGGPTVEEAIPTAVVPVMSVGLTKAETESKVSVDAARVNPLKPLKGKAKVTANTSVRLA